MAAESAAANPARYIRVPIRDRRSGALRDVDLRYDLSQFLALNPGYSSDAAHNVERFVAGEKGWDRTITPALSQQRKTMDAEYLRLLELQRRDLAPSRLWLWILIIVVLLLLIAGGVALYFYLRKRKAAGEDAGEEDGGGDEEEPAEEE